MSKKDMCFDWMNPPDLRDGEPAKFEYWRRIASWTAEEAAALSLGVEPDWVESIDINSWRYPACEDYKKLLRLVVRAQQADELPKPILPPDYIAWAEAMGIQLPPELQASLLQPKLPGANSAAAPQQCRESGILLDFLFVFAGAFYGFDPGARRSRVVSAIKSDLDLAGIRVDHTTILGWLRYAARVQGKPVPPLELRSRKSVCTLIVGILAVHYGGHAPAMEIQGDLAEVNIERSIEHIEEAVRLARSAGSRVTAPSS